MKRVVVSVALALTMATAGEQFAMSDADRAMYEEMLENNPADIFVEEGGEIFEEELGGEAALAKFLGIKENELPKYIAGFPRYIEKLGNVVGVDQVLQAMMVEQGKEKIKLKDAKMFSLLAYVKSLANDEQFNIDINANAHMKASYALGEKTFMTARGGRGLSCNSCHSKDIVGMVLRTQPLPDLGEAGAGATWPAYRMTKSSLRTLQRRFQGCMKNALLAVLPIGSKEMVGLELYISKLAQDKQKAIAIPGLKR
ncbi:sulfur oxidation c-type cytochrome SoxA [Sulfurovum mangrovi]|uniref:sulfur oxidation c-type cytochrome SoxA n=1 Tax=Sulfurovum mangrovi TaxID=2893889 RepID=UPI001E43F0F2|nr:sulfur oxidation c-type cytochrome SoxA [Sulfurovum mangrovi]UFH59652.1 sulfur oxidation c-type cytochrome SoxA [Sulfurovum mangrovi]UFH60796.1 sulfur oxidation c-type cytochrome SoxA [Sulfurovum mangrovi]